ncbi:MAG: uracil-DNA glycosylase [Candidatus Theseobacter exili]|nr:uracil-DNA glycosylase [Candidatus Theseobacter exili]
MSRSDELQEFLQETRNYLSLCKEMKWAEYVMVPKTIPVSVNQQTLERLREEVNNCNKCILSETRTNVVFGEGNNSPDVVFIGEAPGRDEDSQGKPFVGRAGQLLTKIIQAMGFNREDVYIANILKCRPPDNRNPLPNEIKLCEPYLIHQLEILRPRVIIALGTFAAQTLLKTEEPIGKLRGKMHFYHQIPLMPTYHPAFLLRSPGKKRDVWQDIKQVMVLLSSSETSD